jgi:hypothetical protein
MTTRLRLPARIRNKRNTAEDFEARVALADRIAELPGIEIIERRDEEVPCRIDIYLSHEDSNRRPLGKPAFLFCSFDRESVTVSGLDQWNRYQVLSYGWGKLVEDRVRVFLPRDRRELETVWLIVQSAHSRLFDASVPETGSQTISTWDWPKFSRTSLQ